MAQRPRLAAAARPSEISQAHGHAAAADAHAVGTHVDAFNWRQRVVVAGAQVGRPPGSAEAARPLTPAELGEMAQACVTMLEVHGRAVEATLSALRAEAGGSLLDDDIPKVRALAEELMRGGRGGP